MGTKSLTKRWVFKNLQLSMNQSSDKLSRVYSDGIDGGISYHRNSFRDHFYGGQLSFSVHRRIRRQMLRLRLLPWL